MAIWHIDRTQAAVIFALADRGLRPTNMSELLELLTPVGGTPPVRTTVARVLVMLEVAGVLHADIPFQERPGRTVAYTLDATAVRDELAQVLDDLDQRISRTDSA